MPKLRKFPVIFFSVLAFLQILLLSRRAAVMDLSLFDQRLALSRGVFIHLAFFLGVLALFNAQKLFAFLKSFFQESDSPFNLAVFRIFLFFSVFWIALLQKIPWYGQMPDELIFPPTYWGTISSIVPFNGWWVSWLFGLFLIAAFFALIGFQTRIALWACVILGVYVLGVPQFYGKINHYHYLIWFMALMAVSPCADSLSVDSALKAIKKADTGDISPPEKSNAYGLPLKFVMILMGVVYFFPGFWKWWRSGIDWVWSANMKHQMWIKWVSFTDGWQPLVRMDQYPWMYRAMAAGSIILELAFIFLIFTKTGRRIAFFVGQAFHMGVFFIMRIVFVPLQLCYAALVDWKGFCEWLGRKMFPRELYVLYDGNCELCRRTAAVLRRFDLMDRIVYLNALDRTALAEARLDHLEMEKLMKDIHVVEGESVWLGYQGYQKIAQRIPALWLVWPLMYLWPIPMIGQKIYRRVADSRACTIARPPLAEKSQEKRWNSAPAVLLFIFFFVVNVYLGARYINSWPVTRFPTFAKILEKPEKTILEIQGFDASGNEVDLNLDDFIDRFRTERFWGLVSEIIEETQGQDQIDKLKALVGVWKRYEPAFENTASIRFYQATISTIPEDDAKVLSRKLLLDLNGF